MLPEVQMRMLIGAALLIAGSCCWWAAGLLAHPDGHSGLSLIASGQGPLAALRAVVVMLLACLPALAMGLLISALGNPLGGVFVLAGSLTVAAIRGGPIDGLLWRADSLALYYALLAELAIWAGLFIAFLWFERRTRRPLRMRFRRWARRDHLGHHLNIDLPRRPGAWIAGLLCAGGGGFGAYVLIQSTATGQLVGSLLLAFLVSATFAHLLIAQWNPIPILLAPLLAASVAYGYVLWQFESYTTFVHAANAGQVWGPALVPPIYYVSAGIAGCAMGVGLGQAIEHSRAVQNFEQPANQ